MPETGSKISSPLDFTAQSFSPKNSTDYYLSFVYLPFQIQISIIHSESKELLKFKKFKFTQADNNFTYLKKIFKQESLLTSSYKENRIAISPAPFTIIPSNYYGSKYHKDYLQWITTRNTTPNYADYIKPLNAYLVYTIDSPLKKLLTNHFNNYKLFHAGTPPTDFFLKEISQRAQIAAYVLNQHLHLWAFDDKQLLLYNTFNYTSYQDLAYYIMLVYEQLAWNPEETPLLLYGEINKEDYYFQTIHQYIRTINCGEPPSNVKFSKGMEQLKEKYSHHFLTSYCLHLCE